jgi:tetratricopeptide (TPR) repeat protein
VSLAGAGSFAYIPNSGSNNISNLNKSDEAITAYDKAIEINSHDSVAWNNKGRALYKLNKFDETIKAYDKAIEINPLNSAAWYNKAVTLDD